MHKSNNTGLKLITLPICVLLPLAVSSMQGGNYFHSLGQGDAQNSAVMFVHAAALIFSGPIMGCWAGVAWRGDKTGGVIACVLLWLLIALFSNATSSVEILNKTGSTMTSQIQSSPQMVAMQATVDANLASIKEKQAQIDGRDPIRWASKRDGWSNDIAKLNNENIYLLEKMQSQSESGAGSSVATSFAKLEQYGITPTRISLLAAFLLDAISFVACLMMFGAPAKEIKVNSGTQPVKKSQPNLRAVA